MKNSAYKNASQRMDDFWESLFGLNPVHDSCMVLSHVLLGSLFVILMPFLLIYAVGLGLYNARTARSEPPLRAADVMHLRHREQRS